MEPRAFLQFCNDSRVLAEDFTYDDAEDICSKLVEDGCSRFTLPQFTVALGKIAWYKYSMAPTDSVETLLEDHVLPLEKEAQAFLAAAPWEHTKDPFLKHSVIPHEELMHRAYLFYTEEGQPMFFQDYKLFAEDFEIVPKCIALDELRQLYAISPREWMSFEDFIALTQACGANNDAVPEILEEIVQHKSMAGVVEWFDTQTNGLPVDLWRLNPQQSVFEPFKPYLDPARKDEPIRLTDTSYWVTHAAEIAARPADSELLPSAQQSHTKKTQDKPWAIQVAKRDHARNQRIRGRVAAIPGGSYDPTLRSAAPYGLEPHRHQTEESNRLLEEQCVKHRVNLQLLFDLYGNRDYMNGKTGEKEGMMFGKDLHRLIWDAGILMSHVHKGLHEDVNDYFTECVGAAYREGLKLSFQRFKDMLVRTAEHMSKQRNRVKPFDHIVDSVRDLVRDYLQPLCHAHFWKEASQ